MLEFIGDESVITGLEYGVKHLPKEYENLNTKVWVFADKKDLKTFLKQFKHDRNFRKEMKKPFLMGAYAYCIDMIFLFPYRLNCIAFKDIEIFSCFFHELRHAKQYYDNQEAYLRAMEEYVTPSFSKREEYLSQVLEVEANAFAKHMIQKIF